MKDDYPLDLTDPFRPLPRYTAVQLRALYERNPTAELRAALWEIHRLQSILVTTLERLSSNQPQSLESRISWVKNRLLEEPCVDETRHVDYKKRYQDAIDNSGRHWGKEALARAESQRAAEAKGTGENSQ